MVVYGYLLPTRGSVLGSDDASSLAARTRADVIGLAERAEAMDFRSVWVGDSVLAKPRHEPLSTLAAVSGATESVDLGTAVYLPALRHPVNVAHHAATVAQLSGGRLRLGVGVGTGPDVEAEHGNLDVPYAERGRRLNETLEILSGLWTGDPVDYDGRYYQLDAASLGFEPVSTPPVYVATSGLRSDGTFPEPILDRLVEHGDGWLPISIPPGSYAEALDVVRTALEDGGRDPAALDPAIYLDIVIDDGDAALAEARRFYGRYYPDWPPLSDDDIRVRGAFGPPATVGETLDAYADAGVETVIVRFTAGNQREQLRAFADVASLP